MMENMGYEHHERLEDKVEKEAEEEEQPVAAMQEEEKQQGPAAQDDERYDTVAKIKLMGEGKRVKEFRVTGNLNMANTKMIMAYITP